MAGLLTIIDTIGIIVTFITKSKFVAYLTTIAGAVSLLYLVILCLFKIEYLVRKFKEGSRED